MPVPDKNLTILIVDDQQRMRWTIKEMLRRMGYVNFHEADDGESAMDKLRYQPINLVLCDWRMPRVTGVEVLRFVREDENLRNLPFILVTAEMNQEIVAEAGELEVDSYLLKPFTMANLESKLNEVLAKRANLSAIDTHLELGQAYIRANQPDKALDEFQQALAINQNSPRTLLALGQIFERQGENDKAQAYLENAIKLAPKFVKAHVALANLYQKTDRAGQAAEHLKQAATISPKNVDRHFQLAQVLVASGQTDEAAKVLKTAMKVGKGQYSDVARRVGEALMAAGLAGEAEAAFQQALEATPQDINLFNRLGIAFRKQGKFQEAVANYQRALGIAPDNEALYYNLARALMEAGQMDAAKRSLGKAIQIKPDFEEARELLTGLLAQQQAQA